MPRPVTTQIPRCPRHGFFQIIGIAVFRDSYGTVWMTQDFAN